jgi:transposase
MAQTRLSMRKLKELARLRYEAGRTLDEIATSAGVARSTVQTALARMVRAGVWWPWPADLAEDELYARLYPNKAGRRPAVAMALPDCSAMRQQLARKGVTRRLLWREYREQHPEGLEYSPFCEVYRRWRKTQDAVMRFSHEPGDKLFVDYAGVTLPLIDRHTGELRPVQIFVATLGHSNYTFAEATLSQKVPDWLASHVRAFAFFGGLPQAIVPDNLKSGVLRAHRYDPDINPAYQDLASHYSVAILPARAATPRDKASVESAVQVVERWILAPLRDLEFFSLAQINAAIAPLLAALNEAAFQKRQDSRRIVFETIERPALRPLPERAYEYATWKKSKVHVDYHIEIDRRYYSVPHGLIGRTLEVRLTDRAVEIFDHGQRVAAHPKGTHKGQFSTDPAHRPEGHRAVVELSHARVLKQAEAIGTATAAVIRAQSDRRRHRDDTLRSSQGIVRLAQDFSNEALEAACQRALKLNSLSYRAIATLIKTAPAQCPLPLPRIDHANVRGPDYFAENTSC